MIAAMTLFAGNDALLKLASATLPPGQIMAVRGVFATVLSVAVVAASRQLLQVRVMLAPIVVLRACLEASIAFLFITSVAVLPLANITAILQATPIIMTLVAVIFGIERVGWRRWSAVITGFVGVLLIVRPGPAGFDPYALIAFATAALVAGRDFATRAIGAHVPSLLVTLSTSIGVCLAGFGLGMTEEWHPLAASDLLILTAAAVVVTAGNFAVITAFRDTEVSVVSPFRYSNVPFAIILGLAIFGELPDIFALAGIALIVGSGLYTLHRERVRRREAGRERPSPAPAEATP
jgi:drug/metabolite transporter (DMT)-like permease